MAHRPSLMIISATAVSFMLMAAHAGAQTASSDTAMSNGAGASSMSASSTKAQRKEARKAARAHKNAELKQLEKNGYNPSRNNLNYPDDIQKAEKKAGTAGGASQ
jgi:hypothetical protein